MIDSILGKPQKTSRPCNLKINLHLTQALVFTVVPGARIELAQSQVPRDFKSLASTNSATQAHKGDDGEAILFFKIGVKILIEWYKKAHYQMRLRGNRHERGG